MSMLVLHGTPMTRREFEKAHRRDRATWAIPCSVLLLMGIFGVGAAGTATVYSGVRDGALLWGTALIAAVLAVLGWREHRRARIRAEEQAYKLYVAAWDGGVVTTVWPDRVEQVSPVRRWTVLLNEHTTLLEDKDFLLVRNGTAEALFRAEDLTAEEAFLLCDMVCAAVPPSAQFATGRFCGLRAQSTPPPFPVAPPVCYDKFVYIEYAPAKTVVPAGLILWLLACTIITVNMFTALFAFTADFFWDWLLYFWAAVSGVAMVSGVVLLLRRRRIQAAMITLSFTGRGLLIRQAGGGEQFVAAADVHARRTANGARLFTPAGIYTFPWTATNNRQQLEWMLFGQRPASF